MKVVALGYKQQRLVIDGVDAVTAGMVAAVLNDISARSGPGQDAWFYSSKPDEYEVFQRLVPEVSP